MKECGISLPCLIAIQLFSSGCPGDEAGDSSPTPAQTGTPAAGDTETPIMTATPTSSETPPDETAETATPAPVESCETEPAAAPCCTEPAARVTLCAAPEAPNDEPFYGHFLSWEEGMIVFEQTDGTQYSFEIRESGDGLALLPDLSSYETLGVIHDGQCTDENGPIDELYIFTGEYPGEPVMQIGSNWTGADLGSGWIVEPDYEDTTCPVQDGSECYPYNRSVPVNFSHGQTDTVMWQGDVVEVEDSVLSLLNGLDHVGAATNSDCGDEGVNYLILPAGHD